MLNIPLITQRMQFFGFDETSLAQAIGATPSTVVEMLQNGRIAERPLGTKLMKLSEALHLPGADLFVQKTRGFVCLERGNKLDIEDKEEHDSDNEEAFLEVAHSVRSLVGDSPLSLMEAPSVARTGIRESHFQDLAEVLKQSVGCHPQSMAVCDWADALRQAQAIVVPNFSGVPQAGGFAPVRVVRDEELGHRVVLLSVWNDVADLGYWLAYAWAVCVGAKETPQSLVPVYAAAVAERFTRPLGAYSNESVLLDSLMKERPNSACSFMDNWSAEFGGPLPKLVRKMAQQDEGNQYSCVMSLFQLNFSVSSTRDSGNEDQQGTEPVCVEPLLVTLSREISRWARASSGAQERL